MVLISPYKWCAVAHDEIHHNETWLTIILIFTMVQDGTFCYMDSAWIEDAPTYIFFIYG